MSVLCGQSGKQYFSLQEKQLIKNRIKFQSTVATGQYDKKSHYTNEHHKLNVNVLKC